MSGYNGSEQIHEKWQSFAGYEGEPVTAGTIFHIAREKGWRPKEYRRPITNMQNHKTPLFARASDLLRDMKPPQWLIEGYQEQKTMCLLFGDPAAGKSFLAIDMACCVATGKPWHGHKVKQGTVFYIAGEGHGGITRRLGAWARHNGVSFENTPLFVSNRAVQFCSGNGTEEVVAAIKELLGESENPPDLIVIDTVARNFGNGDESSTQDMGNFISAVDDLKHHYGAAIQLVHHTGHTEKNRARGASALKGAVDHEYKIEKQKEGILSMIATKTKDSANPPPKAFLLHDVQFEHKTPDGALMPITSAAVICTGRPEPKKKALPAQAQKLLEHIRREIENTSETSEIKGIKHKVTTSRHLRNVAADVSESDNPDTVRRAIERNLKTLKERGILGTYEDFIFLSDKPDKAGQIDFHELAQTDGQDTPL